MPCTPAISQLNHKPVCQRLSFSRSDDEDASVVTASDPFLFSTAIPQKPSLHKLIYNDDLEEGEEEDFQTVNLNAEHWDADPAPDRCLCIYEHLLPHSLCATHAHTSSIMSIWIPLKHHTVLEHNLGLCD